MAEQVAWQYGIRAKDGYVHFIEGASHNEVQRMATEGGGTFMRRKVVVSEWEEAA